MNRKWYQWLHIPHTEREPIKGQQAESITPDNVYRPLVEPASEDPLGERETHLTELQVLELAKVYYERANALTHELSAAHAEHDRTVRMLIVHQGRADELERRLEMMQLAQRARDRSCKISGV